MDKSFFHLFSRVNCDVMVKSSTDLSLFSRICAIEFPQTANCLYPENVKALKKIVAKLEEAKQIQQQNNQSHVDCLLSVQ